MSIDFQEWVNYLDRHSGAAVTLATIVLAIVTLGYVWFTHRLVRTQYAGVKREIVEQVYKPISNALAKVLEGSPPYLVKDWQTIKESHAFLAYHFLLPNRLRKSLDDLDQDIAKFAQADHETLREGASRFAAQLVGYPLNAGVTRVSITLGLSPVGGSCDVVQIVIPPTPPDRSIFRAYVEARDEFVVPSVTTERADGGQHGENAQAIPVDEFPAFVQRLREAVEAGTATEEVLQRYRSFLLGVARIRGRITKEITRGSKL